MATRAGGTVTSVSSNGSAKVHYDEPLPDGEDVIYTDLTDDELAVMLKALGTPLKVDVTTTEGTTDVTGVTARV